jgi:hypothetical protein
LLVVLVLVLPEAAAALSVGVWPLPLAVVVAAVDKGQDEDQPGHGGCWCCQAVPFEPWPPLLLLLLYAQGLAAKPCLSSGSRGRV